MAQVRDPVAETKQLLHLLLVFREDNLGTANLEKMGNLFIERIAIYAEAHGADRMSCDLTRDPVGPVVPDKGDDIILARPRSTNPSAKSCTRV